MERHGVGAESGVWIDGGVVWIWIMIRRHFGGLEFLYGVEEFVFWRNGNDANVIIGEEEVPFQNSIQFSIATAAFFTTLPFCLYYMQFKMKIFYF